MAGELDMRFWAKNEERKMMARVNAIESVAFTIDDQLIERGIHSLRELEF
jgi:hypothetical protein